MALERRAFLKGSVAVAGGVALAGPFAGFVAGPAAARGGAPFRALRAIPDERDGQVRLHLPEDFRYRSFHDTEFPVVLDDDTALPGRHDYVGDQGRAQGAAGFSRLEVSSTTTGSSTSPPPKVVAMR